MVLNSRVHRAFASLIKGPCTEWALRCNPTSVLSGFPSLLPGLSRQGLTYRGGPPTVVSVARHHHSSPATAASSDWIRPLRTAGDGEEEPEPRRTTILERMFGRKSVKHNSHSVDRVSSLERAKITAELLDTKWSTNLSRGSSSHNSNDQPSKSIVADAGNSDQMETSEILLPEHSFDHGKEMESNCNNSDCNFNSPVGGRNSSANETDNCLQTTSVKEEVVEIYTHEISDLRITSTTDQAESEYLSNDLGTDKSIHESVDTLGGSLHNFEDITGRDIHTKEFLSDGVFEIHSVDTEITNGKREVVSHFVTGDSGGANQNSADTNLPTYRTTVFINFFYTRCS